MSVIQEKIVNNGHGSLNASYFCVHSTANPGATAANHVSLWSRNYLYAVHLVSDWTEAFHTVPYNRLCFQVGDGNPFVEGLEICEATNEEDFRKGIEVAIQVVRERLAAHGWGVDRLINHDIARNWWGGTDHQDPLPYFSKWGYSWDQFKNDVANGSMSLTSTSQTVQAKEGKSMYLIETTTPWGATAYALITELSGAQALQDIEALSYANGLGSTGKVNWDMYNLLVSQAWQRYNTFMEAVGKTVTESVEEATKRVTEATKTTKDGE
ncbi:peptidoglycan recognition protein family protein [Alloscardovia omnicolens]|uniref:peptidoglycan recognition protein family protein n=1 Tax=Alloscardovia omnicolens TaxID=419015 RepID=UPI00242FF272|nr:N-acetylmuramoyl-L-alanine amidase [Alloscardovia omnicolens]